MAKSTLDGKLRIPAIAALAFRFLRSTNNARIISRNPIGIKIRIWMNIGQMFFCDSAAIIFQRTLINPDSMQTTAPNMKIPLWKRFPTRTADSPKNITGTKSTNASVRLKPSGIVSLVILFRLFLEMGFISVIFPLSSSSYMLRPSIRSRRLLTIIRELTPLYYSTQSSTILYSETIAMIIVLMSWL